MNRCDLQYKVTAVDYHFGSASDEPQLALTLDDIRFADGNLSYIYTYRSSSRLSNGPITICFNKTTFNEHCNGAWNGTEEDAARIKGSLVGKLFKLDLGLKTKEPK